MSPLLSLQTQKPCFYLNVFKLLKWIVYCTRCVRCDYLCTFRCRGHQIFGGHESGAGAANSHVDCHVVLGVRDKAGKAELIVVHPALVLEHVLARPTNGGQKFEFDLVRARHPPVKVQTVVVGT